MRREERMRREKREKVQVEKGGRGREEGGRELEVTLLT